ncbi:unnamed protein product [Plutella xylostella]|uniref:(diamondback moth) hypothetical protein n=1 Tax=Plutella xylostella TaxID=51655 RepID=A0A8S4G4J7_PLUXY|nr:insulin-related peptide 2 [Plutella xylostella]XP_037964647.1 insulin-related peptide 2 [Plutella xylostella]CAG9134377.1 unnamed protein product [Plutella xylostella]
MKAAAVVLLLAVAAAAQDNGKVVLCGRRLAEARELLCFGSEPRKRSNMDNFITNSDEDKWSVDPEVSFSRQAALAGRWARGKRIIFGLVDECCNKPCAPNEILNYC